jgi:predicted amidohydrolase
VKVTVCELSDQSDDFVHDWERLATHIKAEASQLVLLPEMPFYPFFATTRPFDPLVWQAAIAAHDRWQMHLVDLAPALVVSCRPVNVGSRRLNEGFIWDTEGGYRAAHAKYYLPEEEGFWESSWYQRGDGDFSPIRSGPVLIGFEICSELWFMERARTYGKTGVHLIVTPRATGKATLEKWLTGGRVAAIVAGAYSLSSNRVSSTEQLTGFGGQGWVIGPDGDVLALTSRDQPFVTVEVDLNEANQAKHRYPRYLPE